MGHIGIEGNKEVDSEAKKAVEGEMSDKVPLTTAEEVNQAEQVGLEAGKTQDTMGTGMESLDKIQQDQSHRFLSPKAD